MNFNRPISPWTNIKINKWRYRWLLKKEKGKKKDISKVSFIKNLHFNFLFSSYRTLPHTLRRNSTKNTTQPGIASLVVTLDLMWRTRLVISSTSTWDKLRFCCSRVVNLMPAVTTTAHNSMFSSLLQFSISPSSAIYSLHTPLSKCINQHISRLWWWWCCCCAALFLLRYPLTPSFLFFILLRIIILIIIIEEDHDEGDELPLKKIIISWKFSSSSWRKKIFEIKKLYFNQIAKRMKN